MKCTNCGAELYAGDRFCMRCGARAPEEPAPVLQPQQPEAQPPPPPLPPPTVEAERLKAQPPPPPPPVFVAPQPAAPAPKKGSGRKWVIVGVLGVLAVACVLVAFSGAWMLGRLSRTWELTIGEPTSTPRLAPTRMPTFSPTPTRQPTPTPSPTELAATPTTAPEPTAQGGIELFSCTSADLDCGWETFSGTYGDVSAVGPELLLVARDSGLVETEIPGVSVQDFYLHFVAKLSSESEDVGYSAAFRCDPESSATFSYEFEVLASGEYRVWMWMDGDPTMLDSGTTDLDPSEENAIEVVAQGPSVSFLVNGEPVAEMTDAELREGPIHLIATVYEEGDLEVAISDVVVQAQGSPSPRPSSTTAPTSVPPSPTPTQPALTSVPPSPTPTRGPVEFDPVIFAQGLNAEHDPITPGTSFPSGTTVVYAVFACRGMYQGLEVQAIWYHNGQEYFRFSNYWDETEERGRSWFWLDRVSGQPLPSGNYRLDVYAEGRLLQSGTFTIQ